MSEQNGLKLVDANGNEISNEKKPEIEITLNPSQIEYMNLIDQLVKSVDYFEDPAIVLNNGVLGFLIIPTLVFKDLMGKMEGDPSKFGYFIAMPYGVEVPAKDKIIQDANSTISNVLYAYIRGGREIAFIHKGEDNVKITSKEIEDAEIISETSESTDDSKEVS